MVLAVVVPRVVLKEEPLKRLKVTFELGSALPVIVGVGSFGAETLAIDEGAFGGVVSKELDVDESTLPDLVDFPAKVSIGINRKKPNVDNKTVVL